MQITPKTESEIMLFACAKITKFAISQDLHNLERKVIAKMLVEGFRKAHDKAVSTFGSGKFLGHTLWSEKALKLLLESGNVDKNLTDRLRHEHAVPLIYFVEKILFKIDPEASLDFIYETIKKFGVVVIIARDEDTLLKPKNSMPQIWGDESPLTL